MPSSANYILHLQHKQAREITVWLGKEDMDTKFWCPYCRNGIFAHRQRIIAIMNSCPDLPFLTAPISIQCSNPNCGAIFHIQGFNES